MILTILLWFSAFFMIMALGLGVQSGIQKFRPADKPELFDEVFFSGFLAISLLCGYLSIWFAIGPYLLIGLIILSVMSMYLHRGQVIGLLSRTMNSLRETSWMERSYLIFIPLFLSLASSTGISNYDTGLYHSQAIQWIQQFSVVPGLGNLHGRLAFNSMYFPLSALFTVDSSLWGNALLLYPLNGLLLSVLLFWEFFAIKKARAKGDTRRQVYGYIVSLFSLLILSSSVSSPTPDVATAVLVLYLIGRALDWASSRDSMELLYFAALIFLCVTFKLSTMWLILLIAVVGIPKPSLRMLWRMAGLGILIGLPFLIRNYFLSGYLIYPFPGLDFFDPDWKLPLSSVITEQDWILSWARLPGAAADTVLSMSVSEWIGPWFSKENVMVKALLIADLLLLPLTIVHWKRKRYDLLRLDLFLIINLTFWFFSAPDPRFMWGVIIAAAALSLAEAVAMGRNVFSSLQGKQSRKWAFSWLVLMLVVVAGRKDFVFDLAKSPSYAFIPAEYQTVEVQQNIASGACYAPTQGELCFDAPIPCAPECVEGLMLRGKGLREGYRIELREER